MLGHGTATLVSEVVVTSRIFSRSDYIKAHIASETLLQYAFIKIFNPPSMSWPSGDNHIPVTSQSRVICNGRSAIVRVIKRFGLSSFDIFEWYSVSAMPILLKISNYTVRKLCTNPSFGIRSCHQSQAKGLLSHCQKSLKTRIAFALPVHSIFNWRHPSLPVTISRVD